MIRASLLLSCLALCVLFGAGCDFLPQDPVSPQKQNDPALIGTWVRVDSTVLYQRYTFSSDQSYSLVEGRPNARTESGTWYTSSGVLHLVTSGDIEDSRNYSFSGDRLVIVEGTSIYFVRR